MNNFEAAEIILDLEFCLYKSHTKTIMKFWLETIKEKTLGDHSYIMQALVEEKGGQFLVMKLYLHMTGSKKPQNLLT